MVGRNRGKADEKNEINGRGMNNVEGEKNKTYEKRKGVLKVYMEK